MQLEELEIRLKDGFNKQWAEFELKARQLLPCDEVEILQEEVIRDLAYNFFLKGVHHSLREINEGNIT